MIETRRIIPALLLRGNGLYKTVKFKNPSYVGDPINAIRIFNEKEVDELMVLDIDATKKKNEPNFDLISDFASECFMPLTYGGGISSLKQAEKIFSLGVEKILVKSVLFSNINFLRELVENFGSSAIVISLDVKKSIFNSYQLFVPRGVENKNFSSLKNYIDEVNDCLPGEVLLNNTDRDGLMNGQDLKLINFISKNFDVPLISLGGIGSTKDIRDSFEAGADAVAAGAFFVYHGPHRAVLITYPKKSEIRNLILSNEPS